VKKPFTLRVSSESIDDTSKSLSGKPLFDLTETHGWYRSKLEFQDISIIQRVQPKKYSKYRRRNQKTGVEKLFESRFRLLNSFSTPYRRMKNSACLRPGFEFSSF
jgi:hypothetical protein